MEIRIIEVLLYIYIYIILYYKYSTYHDTSSMFFCGKLSTHPANMFDWSNTDYFIVDCVIEWCGRSYD